MAVEGRRRELCDLVDDTEFEVQRRVVWGLEFTGDATLEGAPAYKRGTGGFGLRAALEEEFGEGTSRLKLPACNDGDAGEIQQNAAAGT